MLVIKRAQISHGAQVAPPRLRFTRRDSATTRHHVLTSEKCLTLPIRIFAQAASTLTVHNTFIPQLHQQGSLAWLFVHLFKSFLWG